MDNIFKCSVNNLNRAGNKPVHHAQYVHDSVEDDREIWTPDDEIF
ncbi:hypothetical protein [Pantoea sp. AMG 501]|nr:hypothetical protein [Pantoea sp. AMG 501]